MKVSLKLNWKLRLPLTLVSATLFMLGTLAFASSANTKQKLIKAFEMNILEGEMMVIGNFLIPLVLFEIINHFNLKQFVERLKDMLTMIEL